MDHTLKIYQIDAFVKQPFSGNPAAVCPLDEWLPDEVMQNIAMENNLAETAFTVKEADGYRIRWFTPTTEVRLCGHATLATGFAFYEKLGFSEKELIFNCQSGRIGVQKNGDLLTLDFPLDELNEIECPENLSASLGAKPIQCFKGKDDFLLIFENEDIIRNFRPDFNTMSKEDCRGCLVTSGGKEFDVVVRGFFPQTGINEDPATGSAQTTLGAYWPSQLGKNEFSSCQLSHRKGFFQNKVNGNRIHISGKCNMYLEGDIFF